MNQKIQNIAIEKVNDHIVNWLKTYAINAKVNGFVVGVSGGIDSAVTSTLCAQTGLKTLCVELPIHQAASHVARKKEHISQLKNRFPNVETTSVDLSNDMQKSKRTKQSRLQSMIHPDGYLQSMKQLNRMEIISLL